MNQAKSNRLYHFGIPDMKWGVRRFQNEDGSLTPEGRKRYSTTRDVMKDTSKALGEASKLATTGSKSKTVKKGDYKDLSDDELRKRVQRLNLEEQYGRLVGDTKKVRSGGEWVHEILQDSAITIGIASTAISIYLALKK